MANCYIRFTVTAVRSASDGSMQFADLNFYDENQSRIAYPSGTTVSTNMSTYSGEGASNILDNNVSTKVCGVWQSSGIWFVLTIPDDAFLSNVKYYNYCTANDANSRDPVSFKIEFSLDGESYREVDVETNVSITTSRRTQTQKWGCELPLPYKSSGSAVFTISNYDVGGDDSLYWTANLPSDTNIRMFTKVNNGSYSEVSQSGGLIVGLPSSGTCTLYVKAELSTSDSQKTPVLSSVVIKSLNDKKVVVLNVAIPNLRSAIGRPVIAYDGLGGLQGLGGPSDAFSGSFNVPLPWWGNQNDEEHIEMTVSAVAAVIPITYQSATSDIEHIDMSASATVVLTNIHDL